MFETGYFPTPLDKAREALGRFREAHQAGLFSSEAAQIFNEALKQLTVSENTSVKKLHDAYERAGRELETRLGIPPKALNGIRSSQLADVLD